LVREDTWIDTKWMQNNAKRGDLLRCSHLWRGWRINCGYMEILEICTS
jgi:hypothetical protein